MRTQVEASPRSWLPSFPIESKFFENDSSRNVFVRTPIVVRDSEAIYEFASAPRRERERAVHIRVPPRQPVSPLNRTPCPDTCFDERRLCPAAGPAST
jgi:hypothetical protein